jgi:hypothetical protein
MALPTIPPIASPKPQVVLPQRTAASSQALFDAPAKQSK